MKKITFIPMTSLLVLGLLMTPVVPAFAEVSKEEVKKAIEKQYDAEKAKIYAEMEISKQYLKLEDAKLKLLEAKFDKEMKSLENKF